MTQRSFIQGALNLRSLNIKYSSISALGTYLVLYSALLPFSNNIIEAFYPSIKTQHIEQAGTDASTVIWCLGMCLQASLIILASFFKPYTLAYAFPIFSSLYSSAFYVLYLLNYKPNENFWFFLYIFLIVALLLSLMETIRYLIKAAKTKEKTIRRALNEYTKED